MSQRELPWNERETRTIRTRLLGFFDERRRALPWRSDEPDPWGVLVSEVMSQQTRIETVVPYYRRWMARFPNPAALAEAPEEEVLALWEGLGYYSRARHLQSAARELERRYGGRIPSDPDELRELPGVGPYTAGAVASIAFGVPAPAVDGNVRRVLSRLLDEARPSPARLTRWAGALVDPERPGDFNQALMELGSQVCTPRTPSCEACPVAGFCGARRAGTAEARPAPRTRGPVPQVDEAVLVLVHEPAAAKSRRLFVRRRPSSGLLGGMWEFPGATVEGEASARGVAASLGPGGGPHPAEALRALGVVRHAFSHRAVRYHPFLRVIDGSTEAAERTPAAPGRWVDRDELDRLPVPVAQRAILRAAEASLA